MVSPGSESALSQLPAAQSRAGAPYCRWQNVVQPIASGGTMPVQNKAGQQHGTLVGACSAASFYSCSVVCLMERKMTLLRKLGYLWKEMQVSQIYCAFGVPEQYNYGKERGWCVRQEKKKKTYIFYGIWRVNSKCKKEAGEVWWSLTS